MTAEMRDYRNIVSDNRRWLGFQHRPGDVVVATHVLTTEELGAYERRAMETLPADARSWLAGVARREPAAGP